MKLLLTIAILLSCAPLRAHDFWIEPSTYRPAAGTTVTLALRVGQGFIGDAVPRSTELIDAFVVRDAAGTRAVAGFEGRDPAGIVRANGAAVVGYRSKGEPLELPRAKFEQFLREEGLQHLRTGVLPEVHRERFYRYAKTLLGDDAALAQTPLGFRLELVPLRDDWFSVLFESKPLPNALVTAIDRDDPNVRVAARSDGRGLVSLPLRRGRVWLIKSTYLVRAEGDKWESLWASLTLSR
ncbi:MAG TPA: DUF4198 domain-containing protein [Thermoanaerobaculia bacterium]